MTSLPRSPTGGRTQVQLPLQQRVLWCLNETDAQNGHTARKVTGFSCIGIISTLSNFGMKYLYLALSYLVPFMIFAMRTFVLSVCRLLKQTNAGSNGWSCVLGINAASECAGAPLEFFTFPLMLATKWGRIMAIMAKDNGYV
jgi:hypothetical protein